MSRLKKLETPLAAACAVGLALVTLGSIGAACPPERVLPQSADARSRFRSRANLATTVGFALIVPTLVMELIALVISSVFDMGGLESTPAGDGK